MGVGTIDSAYRFASVPHQSDLINHPGESGMLYLCMDTNQMFVYQYQDAADSNCWVQISQSEEDPHGSHTFKLTNCPNCGATLPLIDTDGRGICQCDYCKSNIYVWS